MILPLPENIREQLDKIMYAPDAKVFIMKLFVLSIIPAVCEEIYFRGFFQTSLTAHWGAGWAILVTSVVFAAMHGNFYYFHLYILLGLVFGWAYYISGTLWASIACHVFNNCWTFVNHVRGFKLPLEDVPVYQNALVFIGGLTIFFVLGFLIRKRTARG
jgi:membrane protease YdiL (CAAX protease family)